MYRESSVVAESDLRDRVFDRQGDARRLGYQQDFMADRRLRLCRLEPRLNQDVFDDISEDVGEAEVSAGIPISQLRVVHSQVVQNRCV